MRKMMTGIIVILLLAAVPIAAQDDGAKPTIGVKIGGSLAKNTGDGTTELMGLTELAPGLSANTSYNFGFAVGGFANFPLSPSFSIRPELLYAEKGGKEDLTDGVDKVEFKTKLSYLEIPVLMVVNVPTEGQFQPNFFAGPQIGILTSASWKVQYLSFPGSVKDVYKSMDFGVVFGAGFAVKQESFSIFFDARYDLGLTKVIDKDEWNKFMEPIIGMVDAQLSSDPDNKNSSFGFLVGVGF